MPRKRHKPEETSAGSGDAPSCRNVTTTLAPASIRGYNLFPARLSRPRCNLSRFFTECRTEALRSFPRKIVNIY